MKSSLSSCSRVGSKGSSSDSEVLLEVLDFLAEGVRAAVSDLRFLVPSGCSLCLFFGWLELSSEGRFRAPFLATEGRGQLLLPAYSIAYALSFLIPFRIDPPQGALMHLASRFFDDVLQLPLASRDTIYFSLDPGDPVKDSESDDYLLTSSSCVFRVAVGLLPILFGEHTSKDAVCFELLAL